MLNKDEDLKRAIELSKSTICISSDEDTKKAIELSLASNNPIYISDDEFDTMCRGSDTPLRERASKSSLSSEDGGKTVIGLFFLF